MKVPSGSSDRHFVIPSLDGLRTVSIALVIAAHGGLAHWVPGGFGVTVFFFLSGYLITTLMRMEFERARTVDLKAFYLRRALRIWPPFYLVMLGGIALHAVGLSHGELRAAPLAAQALHVWNYWTIYNGWGGTVPGSGVYWSLAVEEHFYLVFPALYLLLRHAGLSGRAQAQVFWSLCAAVLAWRCALVLGFDASDVRTNIGTDTRIDSMLFGCALAVHNNPVLDREVKERPRAGDLLPLGIGLVGLVGCLVYRDPVFRETFRYTIQGICLHSVFVAALRFPDFGPFALLNLQPMRFLGTLSYSMYLVHHTLMDIVGMQLPYWGARAQLLVSVPLTVVVAYAIWMWVEQPCAKLRRSLAQPKRSEEQRPQASTVGEHSSPKEV